MLSTLDLMIGASAKLSDLIFIWC